MVISFLGCGWLGTPLAHRLLERGFRIRVSTTSPEKLAIWSTKGVDSFLVHFKPDTQAEIGQLLDADVLLVTIPPRRKNPDGHGSYLEMIEAVCAKAPGSPLQRIIFTSSTSVYDDECDVVTENSIPLPKTPGGDIILAAEQRLLALPIPVTVARLAGLIGPGRMPGKFFAGKTDIPNGDAPVNLLHLDDAVNFLEKLIIEDSETGFYNVCSPSHPSRREFYTLAAQKEGLALPGFIQEKTTWKVVASDREFGRSFEFVVPDLIAWLNGFPDVT